MSDSLAELGAALAAVSRQGAHIGPADDAAAFAFVTDLASALDAVPGLLARVFDLMEIAALGPATREHVASRLDELHRTRQRLEADRATLRELRPVLDRLRTAAVERDRLAGELSELLRLRELAGELAGLEAQRALLDDRYDELTAVGDAERELAEIAEAVVVLTEEQLAKVGERTAEMLTRAEQTGRRLAKARKTLADEQARLDRLNAELREAVEGFAALREQSERRLPSIDGYRLAERRLLEGMGGSPLHDGCGVDYVNHALDDLDRRLADVKAALKIALAVHDAAYEEARALLPVQ
jgi:chromosome segregation ATPase